MPFEPTGSGLTGGGEAAASPAHEDGACGRVAAARSRRGSYAALVDLVERIRSGRTDGMAELYDLFSKGIRFYLCRQLGPQELDDKIRDTFVVVVQAIRRGELREPERLMGFVRTIVRRQVAAHIDKVVQSRRDQQDMESTVRIADPRGNPEDAAIFHQRNELIQRVLQELGKRDREILTRFYLREQSQDQICVEMCLTETQFRLLKSRAKARFGDLGKKKLAARACHSNSVRNSARYPALTLRVPVRYAFVFGTFSFAIRCLILVRSWLKALHGIGSHAEFRPSPPRGNVGKVRLWALAGWRARSRRTTPPCLRTLPRAFRY